MVREQTLLSFHTITGSGFLVTGNLQMSENLEFTVKNAHIYKKYKDEYLEISEASGSEEAAKRFLLSYLQNTEPLSSKVWTEIVADPRIEELKQQLESEEEKELE